MYIFFTNVQLFLTLTVHTYACTHKINFILPIKVENN